MTRQQSTRRMTSLVSPRALSLLHRVCEACPEVAFAEPADECADGVRWGTYCEVGNDNGVDAYVEAHLSEDYGDPNGGVTFGLHTVGWGGEILGQCTPHNYSPEVWVRRNDLDAVNARLTELESVDLSGIQATILDHLSRRCISPHLPCPQRRR